ncbi:MAG: hypothetical protein ACE5GI_09635 [Candidatus Aminicenantales bacterium]
MKIKTVSLLIAAAFSLIIILSNAPFLHPQERGEPTEKAVLYYRIEMMKKHRWVPVKDTKKFKTDDTIRFRFTCNQEGALYVLSASHDKMSLEPVFSEGTGSGMEKHLGLATYIEAGKVGIFPDPDEGGGLRFTGNTLKERFLFIFVPYGLDFARGMAALAAGAEDWNFDDKNTTKVVGNKGEILFHYFELERK